MTSAEFKPTFNYGVFITGPGGQMNRVNPIFCATPQCAVDLASILADLKPELASGFPLGDWPEGAPDQPNPFTQMALVPWLKFTQGDQVFHSNAGLLAAYWTHGFPPAFAEAQCRGDIALGLRGN